MTRGLQGAVCAITIVAGVLWWIRTGHHAPPAVERGIPAAGESRRVEPDRAHREPAPEPRRVTVEVAGEDGRALPGRACWTTRRGEPPPAAVLAPEYGRPLPAGAGHAEHDGTLMIERSPDEWIWRRLWSLSPRYVAYRRVPPGIRRLRVRVSPARRGVHAICWRADHSAPAAGERLRLYHSPLAAGGTPAPLASRFTDSHGYIFFDDLPPGGFFVCTPGSPPGTPRPYATRFLLPSNMPTQETIVTVVARPETHTVRVETHASRRTRRSPAGAVVVCRSSIWRGCIPAARSIGCRIRCGPDAASKASGCGPGPSASAACRQAR